MTVVQDSEPLGPAVLEGEEATTWGRLSEEAQRARLKGDASAVNEALLEEASRAVTERLAAVLRLWAADNLSLDSRCDEAVALYDEVASTGGLTLGDLDIGIAALERKAFCQEQAGDLAGAIASFRALADRTRSAGNAWALLQVGRVAEQNGERGTALEAYAAAAASTEPSHEGFASPDLARRAALRLGDGVGKTFATVQALIDALAAAIRTREPAELEALASTTHFSVALAGSHRVFTGAPDLLAYLGPSISRGTAKLKTRRLVGTGPKRYLETSGWNDRALKILFLLTQSSQGWEWSGLVFERAPSELLKILDPPEKETNQPLSMAIKSPWPMGPKFQAGGLTAFLVQTGTLAVLAAIWFVGTIIAGAALLVLAARQCGFGTRGFYYNNGPTHRGMDAFAIDFTSYRRFVPFYNESGGTAVLNVALGMVASLRDNVASGDASSANFVQINHLRAITRVGGWSPEGGSWSDAPTIYWEPYSSKYMHMEGPRAIPVSVGMVVRTGARLGRMDDTGNSVINHLHFVMYDTRTGRSVRPTPMDDQALNDGDDAKCTSSTNTPFP